MRALHHILGQQALKEFLIIFQKNILKRSEIQSYYITRDHNVLVVSERVERHKVQVEIDPTKLVQHQVPSTSVPY